MARHQGNRHRGGRIEDARGLVMTQYDPVKAFLLNRFDDIPESQLTAIASELLPGAKRKRLLQIGSMIAGFAFVIGGNFVYFRYISSWKGLDFVSTLIYTVQCIILLSGPILAFRIAKKEYNTRILNTMLKHSRCPHCAYDIHGLPQDPEDHTTRCPECGCSWILSKHPI